MLIGDQKTGRVEGVAICASGNDGLSVMVDGVPARLAIISDDGHIYACGQDVAKEAFNVSVNAYRDFLRGKGHLRTLSPPLTTK